MKRVARSDQIGSPFRARRSYILVAALTGTNEAD